MKNRTWVMISILSGLIIVCSVIYFFIFYVIRPEFIKHSYNEPIQKNNNERITDIDEDWQDYSDAIAITEVIVSDEDQNIIYGVPDLNGNTFEIEDKLDAGKKYRFTVGFRNKSAYDLEDLTAVLVLHQKTYDIEIAKGNDAVYDPFSHKILLNIKKLEANSIKELQFGIIFGKDFDQLETFESQISFYLKDSLISKSNISGKIIAIPDFSSSTVTITDLNGGDMWANDILQYDIVIENNGKNSGHQLLLSYPLPGGVGYIEDSATKTGLTISVDKRILKWNINSISPGQSKRFSFQVFIADYLTFENEINTYLTLSNTDILVNIESPVIRVRSFAFNTIVCMGDSQILESQWPDFLSDLLVQQYEHASFRVIPSGVRGEMATDAIRRFDRDVRINNPDIIVLGYGTNDAGENPALFKYHMDILIRQATSTGAKVFVHGVGYIDTSITKWEDKSNYIDFDEMLKEELCPKYGAIYVDIYSVMSKDPQKYFQDDGIHWNEQGADLVAREVFKAMAGELDSDGNILKQSQ